MKKISILMVFLFRFFCYSYSQGNMVDNPGFETVDNDFNCIANSPKYSEELDYWAHISPWIVAKKKTVCSPLNGVGSSDCDCQGGHYGPHHATCLYFEYVFAPLNTQMSTGHSYYIEFYTKNGHDSGTDAGLRLFEERPEQCGFHPITHDGEPQAEIPNWIDLPDWTKVSQTVVADKYYSWLGLGNYNTAGITTGRTYLFDDIKIYDVGSDKCPAGNYIQNITLDQIGLITYQSQNLTTAGYNVTPGFPVGNVTIGSTGIVDFKSVTAVEILPGFSTEPGAIFTAYIGPCDTRCFPLTVDAGNDQVSCGSQTVQIGSPSAFAQTYSWTATPASAISYLSSTSIANPVFTPPATGFGTIKYTVTASNECGAVGSDDVVVSYNHTVNNTPTVSVSNVVSSDFIEFDVTMGTQTKDLIIEVRNTAGTLLNTYNYTVGRDFNCCSYHWKIPELLSPCTDYQLKVYTKNFCSTVLSTPAIVNWTRNRTIGGLTIPNVFTPNDDGINDSWCVDNLSGAVTYNLQIMNPSGVTVFLQNGDVTASRMCLWNGECNGNQCTGSKCPNGTYYYFLSLTDCAGITHEWNYGYLSLLGGRPSGDDNTTGITEAPKNGIDFLISPNPNKGVFSIRIAGEGQKEDTKITVYDILGNEIESQQMKNGFMELDITSHATGMYFVKIENQQFTKMEKIIFQ